MKRKLFAMSLAMSLVIAACGGLNFDFSRLDTWEKKYQFAQEEWIDALQSYRAYMLTVSDEDKLKMHEKYDEAIHNVDLALDVWGSVLIGSGQEQQGYDDFLEAKNKLLMLGFDIFFKGGDSS